MTDPLIDVAHNQQAAADPAASVWVSANAGSGKTRVLVDRVARLLLAGGAPGKILCLTYTKAAAAEMQDRLFKTLGAWALAPEETLFAILEGLGEKRPDLRAARRLFAEALETPGGLRIQTIHAFCESMLRRFPVEARLSPRFTLMEEMETQGLRRSCAEGAVLELAASPDAEARATARRMFERVSESGGPKGKGGLATLAAGVFRYRELIDTASPPGAAAAAMLGASPEESPAAALQGFRRACDWAGLREAGSHLQGGSDADAARGAGVLSACGAASAEDRRVLLSDALLTKTGSALKTPMTKPLVKARPDLHQLILETQTLLVDLNERLKALDALERATDLERFGRAFLRRYAETKTARGALDFDDLIARAADLIEGPEARAWALFKLDQGVDHILVDEAQDTSPPQWRVIATLADEFFSGHGARPQGRTIFAVGDEKQSIYSFQGADPAEFDRRRGQFGGRLEEAGVRLRNVDLTHSFRSSPVILGLVDAVFQPEAARHGLSAGGGAPAHLAAHAQSPGRVEWWPALLKNEAAPDPEWWRPVDAPQPGDPALRLGDLIAEKIRRWIDGGEPIAPGARAMRAGDILILVRRRNAFSRHLIQALKARSLPVAGEDRLRLTDAMGVKDVLASARTALLPADDLSLAALLRSPFYGFSEEDLISLAARRKGTLWAELTRRHAEQTHWATAWKAIGDLIARVDFLRPYEFFERILIHQDGRRKLLARLGPQAEDPVDELLARALAYEAGRPPTLQGFLDEMDRAEGAEIKRESAQGANEIRVMTAHGAKGLEADVVILPDCCALPNMNDGPATPAPGALLWAGAAADDPPALAAAREERKGLAMDEYRRLLYVALTRPKSRLVVCGWAGAKGPPADSWHRLVEQGMRALDAKPFEPLEGAGEGLLLERDGIPLKENPPPTLKVETLALRLSPLTRAEPAPPPPVAPSRLGLDLPDPAPPDGPDAPLLEPIAPGLTREAARKRGTILHRLLETGRPSPEDPADLVRLAERLRADPAFRDIFHPPPDAEALSEAPIYGPVAALGGRRILGAIDRLILTPGRATVVDFKSGVLPPEPGRIPGGHLRQMAAYAAAVAEIFPGRSVRAGLLWLDGPRLDWLDAAELARVLERLKPDLAAAPSEIAAEELFDDQD